MRVSFCIFFSPVHSAVDSLAMVQLQLMICEVEDACSQLNTINKSSLVDVCSSHPVLIHNDLSSFTPLAQLMRQHMSDTLLEILVEMLDRCVMSFDSLLILLRVSPVCDVLFHPCIELVYTDTFYS